MKCPVYLDSQKSECKKIIMNAFLCAIFGGQGLQFFLPQTPHYYSNINIITHPITIVVRGLGKKKLQNLTTKHENEG